MAQTHLPRIFVSIPSYRDSECQYTIRDLLQKAQRSERIFFGVCFQYDFEKDLESCFKDWPDQSFDHQIRINRVNRRLARGPCWARCQTWSLWKDEEFLLSIDSHTRAIQDWDAILIQTLSKCPSRKPILTTYPVGYEIGKSLPIHLKSTATCAKSIGNDGLLRLIGKNLLSNHSDPLKALFWVAGFSFSSSILINEVPYDPFLQYIFFGEEISMSARLYTNGYDFFLPGINILFHLWNRSYRPNFRENMSNESSISEYVSLNRIKFILNMINECDLEKMMTKEIKERILESSDRYGLGQDRTIEEYQTFCGVHFGRGEITPRAKNAGLSNDFFLDDFISKLQSMNIFSELVQNCRPRFQDQNIQVKDNILD